MSTLKKTTAVGILCCCGLAANAATFTVTLPEVNGAEISSGFPIAAVSLPPVSFAGQIPAEEVITSITASGSFGNTVVRSTASVEVTINGVPVATCGLGAECTNFNDAPTPWSYAFSASELAAFSAGAATLSYVQTYLLIVRLGRTTLTITTGPAPKPIVPTPVPVVGIPALIIGALSIFGAAGFLSRRRRSA